MLLQGMLGNGDIAKLKTSSKEITGLFKKAERKLVDAKIQSVSPESRLEMAYTVILTLATIALRAAGYRVTNLSSTHYIILKTLPDTLKIKKDRVHYFQKLRKKRHLEIYSPESKVFTREASEAVGESERLLAEVKEWLAENHSELIIDLDH